MEGFPWDDRRKIFRGCQRMAKVPNGMETLPTISTGWVGCTNVTDRRQKTDGWVTANSEQECEFTFAKTVPNCNVSFANGEFHQAYGQFHVTICLMNNCERNVTISYSFCAWLCNMDIVIAVSSTWWTFTNINKSSYLLYSTLLWLRRRYNAYNVSSIQCQQQNEITHVHTS